LRANTSGKARREPAARVLHADKGYDFCRLKDVRRVATRYDRLATNFLAAVCLAATVSYWL
jgi:transposase